MFLLEVIKEIATAQWTQMDYSYSSICIVLPWDG